MLVWRHLVAIVEERSVDHLGRRPRHARPEDPSHGQRVKGIAPEQLEEVGVLGVLELVVVERSDRNVAVSQTGAHASAQHETVAERAEWFGEHIGRVAARPGRETLAKRRIIEPAAAGTHSSLHLLNSAARSALEIVGVVRVKRSSHCLDVCRPDCGSPT